ncbi:hypothetical protein ACQY0O_002224 [Thecaphora frezii]
MQTSTASLPTKALLLALAALAIMLPSHAAAGPQHRSIPAAHAGHSSANKQLWRPYRTLNQICHFVPDTDANCKSDLTTAKDGKWCLGLKVQFYSDDDCLKPLGKEVVLRQNVARTFENFFQSFQVLEGADNMSLMFSSALDVDCGAANGVVIKLSEIEGARRNTWNQAHSHAKRPANQRPPGCITSPFVPSTAKVVTSQVDRDFNNPSLDTTNAPRLRSVPKAPSTQKMNAIPMLKLELYTSKNCVGEKGQFNVVLGTVKDACTSVINKFGNFQSLKVVDVTTDLNHNAMPNTLTFSPSGLQKPDPSSGLFDCGEPILVASLADDQGKPQIHQCINRDELTVVTNKGRVPNSELPIRSLAAAQIA